MEKLKTNHSINHIKTLQNIQNTHTHIQYTTGQMTIKAINVQRVLFVMDGETMCILRT